MAAFLRPVLASAGSAAACAVLQGAVVAKLAPDAGWPAATAALQILLLPPAVLWGAAVSLGAGRRPGPAATLLGILAGLASVLVPVLAGLAGVAGPGPLGGWAGLLAGALVLAAVSRGFARGPARLPGPAGPATRRLGLAVLLGSLACGGLGLLLPGPEPAIGRVPEGAPPREGSRRPNIALIVLDTLRADRLGCYGSERGASPFLDGLAARGLRYARAEAPASHTPPSHATLFTGRMPSVHGVMSTATGMPSEIGDTLAGRLAAQGYTTLGVSANFVLRRTRGFARGFHLYDDSLVCLRGLSAAADAVLALAAPGRWWGGLAAGRLTAGKLLVALFRPRSPGAAAADAVIRRARMHLAEAAGRGGPVFLFLNFMDVHTPYQPPAPFRERFLRRDPGVFDGSLGPLAFQRHYAALGEALARGGDGDEETLGALSDLYDGELAWLDGQLAELVGALEGDPSGRPWLLVVTSDHGEHFGEHSILGHGHGLWEETQHVPLLVLGPGIGAGVVEEPVGLDGLGSTILAAAGDQRPLGDGQVLPGLPWSGEAPVERARVVAAEHGDPRSRRLFAPLDEVVLYAGAWKLRLRVDEEKGVLQDLAAWNLDEDPGEARPLPPSRFPAAARESWERSWWERRRRALSRWGGGEREPSGAAAEARLEELGY